MFGENDLRKFHVTRWLCVPSILLVCPLSTQAQLPVASSGRDSVLAAVLLRLPSRAELRVRTSGFPIEGRLERYVGDTLVLGVNRAGSRKFPTAAITELFIRQRQTAHGAVVGAVTVGIIFGLLSGVAVSAFCDIPGGCKDRYPTAIISSAAVGAGSGALIGAGLGSLSFGWRRVFP
jgi:hypothetical protein